MGILKSSSDLRALRQAGLIVRQVMENLCADCQPGVSAMALETHANQLLAASRSIAPFKSFDGFNHAICVSINEEIVNGLPSRNRVIQEGDVVSIATAAEHRGIYAKMARTVYAGQNKPDEVERLLTGTDAVITEAIRASYSCQTLSALLTVVPETAVRFGLSVIEGLGGSGIGKRLHDAPAVPNNPADLEEDVPLTPGLCFTLMPMLCIGDGKSVSTHADGWTLLTGDGSLSAHVADTLLMTETGLVPITRTE